MRSPAKQRSAPSATRAAGYVRVSTEEQAREGFSLAEQRHRIAERAEGEGWQVVEIYADEGWSGRRADRPAYRRLLDDAAAGAFGVLVVWRSDRLGRDTVERLTAEAALERAGVRLVSLTEGEVDGDDASAPLLRAIRAGFAEMESRLIGQRTAAGLAASARLGRHHGRAPFGYRWVGTKGERRMLVDEARAAVVRRIFADYLAGAGVAAIASALDADGVRPPRAETWDRSTVANVLDCPAYVGLVRYNGELFPGEHEPVIDQRTWEQAQIQRADRRGGRLFGPRPNGTHLLIGGILRCGSCGGGMRPRTPKGRQPRYECTNRDRGRACDMRGVVAAEVDGPLLAYLEEQVFDLDGTRAAIAQERDRRLAESEALIVQAESASSEADAALARIRADYVAGSINAEDWQSLRDELESGRAAAVAEAEQLRRRADEVAREANALVAEDEVALRLAELRETVAAEVTSADSLEAVRAALSRVFERISLVRTEDGLVLVPQVRSFAEVAAWADLGDGRAAVKPVPERVTVPGLQGARERS